jgi:hypothetical protein
MNIKKFSKILKEIFEERLNNLNNLICEEYITFDSSYSFNNLLRCVETETHFIGELLGAKRFKPFEKISVKYLRNKNEKISNTNSYFIPGSEKTSDPVINMLGDGNTFQGLSLITNEDFETLQKLPFPIMGAKITRKEGDFPLRIDDNVNLFVLKDISLIAIKSFFYFYRYIPFALIAKKGVTEDSIVERLKIDFQLDMSNLLKNIPITYITGINFANSETIIDISKQLLSFSNQIIQEPLIDKYIAEHGEVISDAFSNFRLRTCMRKTKKIYKIKVLNQDLA